MTTLKFRSIVSRSTVALYGLFSVAQVLNIGTYIDLTPHSAYLAFYNQTEILKAEYNHTIYPLGPLVSTSILNSDLSGQVRLDHTVRR